VYLVVFPGHDIYSQRAPAVGRHHALPRKVAAGWDLFLRYANGVHCPRRSCRPLFRFIFERLFSRISENAHSPVFPARHPTYSSLEGYIFGKRSRPDHWRLKRWASFDNRVSSSTFWRTLSNLDLGLEACAQTAAARNTGLLRTRYGRRRFDDSGKVRRHVESNNDAATVLGDEAIAASEDVLASSNK